MTHQGYVPNPMKLAFFAALLSSSAIASAQEMPDAAPGVVPQEVPVPQQPAVPADVPDEPIVAPGPSSPTDMIAPAARQALEADKTKAATPAKKIETSRRANSGARKPSTQSVAEPIDPVTANVVSDPLPVATEAPADNIAADGTIASEPVLAEPVATDSSRPENNNSAENWLLALAGLGILGIAGGAGVAMSRRRKPVNGASPIAIERIDRTIGNQSPISAKQAQIDMAEPQRPLREPVIERSPVQPQMAERDALTPTSDIPVTDPLFAQKSELPPITDPLFANHPDYVGNKPTFKGFSLNTKASWSEPRRVEPVKELDQPVH